MYGLSWGEEWGSDTEAINTSSIAVLTQLGREISAAYSNVPSPLHFIVIGEARVEVLQGPGLVDVVSSTAELTFSANGTSWASTIETPPNGVFFARYIPPVITVDQVRYLSFTFDGVQHHAEALCLTSGIKQGSWHRYILETIPQAYRDNAEDFLGVVKTLAWLTYPFRVYMQRPELLVDPLLTPAHNLERLRALYGAPPFGSLKVNERRQFLYNIASYYASGGKLETLTTLANLFTSTAVTVEGGGPNRVNIIVPLDTPAPEDMGRQLDYWIPAWLEYAIAGGPDYGGTYSYDGTFAFEAIYVNARGR